MKNDYEKAVSLKYETRKQKKRKKVSKNERKKEKRG
jgi:hypothetical protein